MGGIAGILNSDGSRIDPGLLERMLLSIAGRGPGNHAVCYDAHAALGQSRFKPRLHASAPAYVFGNLASLRH